MKQNCTSNKSWKKIAKEMISKEMPFDGEYFYRQMEKNKRKSIKSLVKKWELKDLERVHSVLKEKGKIDPDVFSRKCSQIIFPLLDKWGTQKEFNEICVMLSKVVESNCFNKTDEGFSNKETIFKVKNYE